MKIPNWEKSKTKKIGYQKTSQKLMNLQQNTDIKFMQYELQSPSQLEIAKQDFYQ
jgi:hypothetical protein